MDYLYSNSFEMFLIAMLAIFTILLFTGHGSFLLKTVKSNQKKRTPEQEKFLSRHLGVVTLLWMIAELIMTIFSENDWVGIVCITIMAISLIYLAKFFKKYD